MNWPLLLNSLLVSGAATALAIAFGLIAALFACGLGRGARAAMLAAAAVALALPPFLVANCWLGLLGQGGAWRSWLPLDIYTRGGTVWILALLLWPIPMFAVLAVWQRIETSLFEVDPALRGPAVIRWLLWPSAWPVLCWAGLAVFVLAFNNFTVPALLQVRVYPAEIWVRFNTNFDVAGTFRSSVPLLALPCVLLTFRPSGSLRWPRLDGADTAPRFRWALGGWWRLAGVASSVLLGLAVVLPLSNLTTTTRTWLELPGAVAAGRGAIVASTLFAASTAALVTGLGVVASRVRWGWVVWWLFLVPGVLLGVALIWALNRPPWVAFYQSGGVVLLALALRYLALGWQGGGMARAALDPDLEDAARLSGAGRLERFWRATLPQMAPSLGAAAYVVYLLCLWDVESLVLIVPPGGETLALRIFNLLHYGHNTQVNALCLVLLGLAMAPPALWYLWRAGRTLGSRMKSAGTVSGSWGVACSFLNCGGHMNLEGRLPSRPPCAVDRLAGDEAVAPPTRCSWEGTGLRVAGLVALAGALTGCTPSAPHSGAIESRFFSRVETIGTRGNGPGQFNKPRSVAVDREDALYVVDITGRVQKFSPEGIFLLSWQMPETDLGKAKGMGLDAAGRVIVIEPHYSRVNHFSPAARLEQQWGVHGTNTGQLAFPRAVAVCSDGGLWVSEYGVIDRMQQFTPDGQRCVRSVGRFGAGPGEFNRPEGLGTDREDRVYVADSCNHRVQVFDVQGGWVRAHGRAGVGPGEFSYPYDVRVDAAGNQFVCEFGNSRLQVFDLEDRPLEIIGGPGAAPGQFNNPWSIALDSQGNLYVADSNNHRVQKLIRRRPAVPAQRASRSGREAAAEPKPTC